MKELWVIERERTDYEGGLYWSTYDTAHSFGAAKDRLAMLRKGYPNDTYRLVRLQETRMVIGI